MTKKTDFPIKADFVSSGTVSFSDPDKEHGRLYWDGSVVRFEGHLGRSVRSLSRLVDDVRRKTSTPDEERTEFVLNLDGGKQLFEAHFDLENGGVTMDGPHDRAVATFFEAVVCFRSRENDVDDR